MSEEQGREADMSYESVIRDCKGHWADRFAEIDAEAEKWMSRQKFAASLAANMDKKLQQAIVGAVNNCLNAMNPNLEVVYDLREFAQWMWGESTQLGKLLKGGVPVLVRCSAIHAERLGYPVYDGIQIVIQAKLSEIDDDFADLGEVAEEIASEDAASDDDFAGIDDDNDVDDDGDDDGDDDEE